MAVVVSIGSAIATLIAGRTLVFVNRRRHLHRTHILCPSGSEIVIRIFRRAQWPKDRQCDDKLSIFAKRKRRVISAGFDTVFPPFGNRKRDFAERLHLSAGTDGNEKKTQQKDKTQHGRPPLVYFGYGL